MCHILINFDIHQMSKLEVYMCRKLKKFFINIILSFIFSSKKRKYLREKWLYSNCIAPRNIFKILIDKINNNKIEVILSNGKKIHNVNIDGLTIKFFKKNSTVIIHAPINLQNCHINIKDNSKVEIFSSFFPISNLFISTTNKSIVNIGKNFSCRECCIESHDEKAMIIKIGEDCMFSDGIRLRSSDGHTIYSTDDHKIINKPQKGISVGNHVWLGMKTTILKDVSIPNNSIVGACSLVNKTFEQENTIIAGTPARVVKKSVNWDRENTDIYRMKD